MKILVTGASGFIGSFLVDEALSRGCEVWAGVRGSSSRAFLQDARIKFINLDFGNRERLDAQLAAFAAEKKQQTDERLAALRARMAKLSTRDSWEHALDWQLGERLRLTEDKVRSHMPDLPQLPAIDVAAQHFREKLGAQERRMLNAFPGMRPSNYHDLARELAGKFNNEE
jgi:NAD(P)-dependent dehydrogenase (short-subunit alcohol dehydrogenase family)